MAKTRSDLIVAVLKLLNVIAAGQNPEAEDVAEIEAIIDGKLDELEARNIIVLADRDEFEDMLMDPLAIVLANTAAPGFGQPRNPDSLASAIATLNAFKPSTYVVGAPQPVDYF